MGRPSFRIAYLPLLCVWLVAASAGAQEPQAPAPPRRSGDAVQDAQTVQPVPITRPEQRKTDHDRSDVFGGRSAPPSSTAFEGQPDGGKMLGFDFARDPLNARVPMQSPDEIVRKEKAARAQVMRAQRALL